MSSKFGMPIDFHYFEQMQSLNLNSDVEISNSMTAILKNRYVVRSPPMFVRLLRLVGRRSKSAQGQTYDRIV